MRKIIIAFTICVTITAVCAARPATWLWAQALLAEPQEEGKAEITSQPQPGEDDSFDPNIEAMVTLRAILAASGKVEGIKLVEVTPADLPAKTAEVLVRKSVEAAKQIIFKPARKNGRPIGMYVRLEYKFGKGKKAGQKAK